MTTLWIRDEANQVEKRTPLTPSDAKRLIEHGHRIVIETSNKRIYTDTEYKLHYCEITERDSWQDAPSNTIIMGLKNLSIGTFPLKHRHIYFAHAYNHQRIFDEKANATDLLTRFKCGNGVHYDIEFLINENNKRVCAFGEIAGVAGACIAILAWLHKIHHPEIEFQLPLDHTSVNTAYSMIEEKMKSTLPALPTVLIIGSEGRCGRGVQKVLEHFHFHWDGWGRKETTNSTTLQTIGNYTLVFNCTYVQDSIPPFLTLEDLEISQNLSLIADISCETSNNNPLKLYKQLSTFRKPTIRIESHGKTIDIIAIDNLPTFFPKESSQDFSRQIYPYLLDLLNSKPSKVWDSAKNIFDSHMTSILQ